MKENKSPQRTLIAYLPLQSPPYPPARGQVSGHLTSLALRTGTRQIGLLTTTTTDAAPTFPSRCAAKAWFGRAIGMWDVVTVVVVVVVWNVTVAPRRE